MCTFGLTGCRVKPRWLLQNVKNNCTIALPPIRLPKKSMTNNCKFCLYPGKKSLEHNRNSTGRRSPPPTFRTLLALIVLFVLLLILLVVAAFLVACVPAVPCCCRCFCCFLCLLLSNSPPLPLLQCLTFQNVNNNFFTKKSWSPFTSIN